jgi:hypothetical protein
MTSDFPISHPVVLETFLVRSEIRLLDLVDRVLARHAGSENPVENSAVSRICLQSVND